MQTIMTILGYTFSAAVIAYFLGAIIKHLANVWIDMRHGRFD